ncbi:MAG: protein kinase domain-containing protein [Bryobacteraceae bacterium]
MQRIGPYEVQEEIGRGGMGVVYRAVDPHIGRPVAVKIIRLGDISDAEEQEQLRGRLFREARAAGILKHSGIVTIYHVGEEQGMAFIAMEHVKGPTLEKQLAGDTPLDKDQVRQILWEIAAALDYAHKKGIVHRDVKPANVILEDGETVKICDFGIAKGFTGLASMTNAGMAIGTPHYMPPEQIQGGVVDARADQYALAVIAFQMLTGQRPFQADSIQTLFYRIMVDPPEKAHKLNPTLPPAVAEVFDKGLAKEPGNRFASCREFVTALLNACDSRPDWCPPPRKGLAGSGPTPGRSPKPAPPAAGPEPPRAPSPLVAAAPPAPVSAPPQPVKAAPALPASGREAPQAGPGAAPVQGPTSTAPGGAKEAGFTEAFADLLKADAPPAAPVSPEPAAARKRAEEIRNLKAACGASIERQEYDPAILALEAGIALFGDDGELSRLLQSAQARKAEQERERAVSRTVEDAQRLRRQGKLEDASRLIEQAIQRWGSDPSLAQLLKGISQERKESERRQRIGDASRRASALIDHKDAAAAIVLLRQSIERDGKDPELQELLDAAESQVRERSRSARLDALREEVRKLVREKRWEEGRRCADAGLSEFPEEPWLVSERASLLAAMAGENREKAIAEALGGIQSLQRENRLPEALELLDKSLANHGADARLLEARERLSERLAERQRAEYLASLQKECRLLLRQGRFDDALRLLEGCQVRFPNTGELAELLAEAESARKAHERKQSIDTALSRASALMQQGEFEACLGILEEGLRAYPDSRDLEAACARARVRRDEADRQREIKQLTESIERAIAEGDWNRAIGRISAGLERFPADASLVRLKRAAEDGKHRSEIAEVETSALQALQDGNSALAAEIVAAAQIRWPDEKKLRKLHHEVELSRAGEDASRAKALLQAGQYDQAEQLAQVALGRSPKLAGALDVLEEIAARKSARTKEVELQSAPVPAPSRSWRPRAAIASAAAVLVIGGTLFWALRPNPGPAEESRLPAQPANALRIGDVADSLPAVAGTPYEQTLQTSGGSVPVSWMVVQGSLPPGLTFDGRSGRIEGTPGKGGAYTFVAEATDSGGHSAKRTLTIAVAEPHQNKTPAKPAEVAQVKPVETRAPAAPEPKTPEPKPVPAVPAPQANAPAPCKAKAFVLDQYGDSRSGELTWTGSLSEGGEVVIGNRRASSGYVRGDILPAGVPVQLTVSPENIRVAAGPSAGNCWDSRLLLHNSGGVAATITIKWVVYQP